MKARRTTNNTIKKAQRILEDQKKDYKSILPRERAVSPIVTGEPDDTLYVRKSMILSTRMEN